jgi:hypothetical protein
MAGSAFTGHKRFMTHRVKQVFFRSAMGIMTGDARFRPRLDPLVGIDKASGVLFVALGAELSA